MSSYMTFQHFMNDSAQAALGHRACASEIYDIQKEERLTLCCVMRNYVLFTYAPDSVISEANAEMINIKQPERRSAVIFLEVL